MEITRTSAPSRSRRGRLSCENILPLAHTFIYLIPYFTHNLQSLLTLVTASFEAQTAQTVAKKRKLGKFSRLTQSTCCKFSLFCRNRKYYSWRCYGNTICCEKSAVNYKLHRNNYIPGFILRLNGRRNLTRERNRMENMTSMSFYFIVRFSMFIISEEPRL